MPSTEVLCESRIVILIECSNKQYISSLAEQITSGGYQQFLFHSGDVTLLVEITDIPEPRKVKKVKNQGKKVNGVLL